MLKIPSDINSLDDLFLFLNDLAMFGMKPGLERMYFFLEKLGNPEKNLKVFHIAGTNGKGSTAAFLARLLASQNFKVGLYTSPSLERLTERIVILEGIQALKDTQGFFSSEVDAQTLISAGKKIVQLCSELENKEDLPTQFEVLTLLAILCFKSTEVDYVVIETGLGGRLDATNIFPKVLMHIITSIDWDHCQILGKTLRAIASEKAGIIRNQAPTCLLDPYTYQTDDVALQLYEVFKKQTLLVKSKLYLSSAKSWQCLKRDVKGASYRLPFRSEPIKLSMPAAVQSHNLALALNACELVLGPIDIKSLQMAVENFSLPARFQCFSENPQIICDAGHNPQAAKVFCDTLDSLDFQCQNSTVLALAFLRDKDYLNILDILLNRLSKSLTAIYCYTPKSARALEASQLAKLVQERTDLPVFFNAPDEHFSKTYEALKKKDTLSFSEFGDANLWLNCDKEEQLFHEMLQEVKERKTKVVIFGSFYFVNMAQQWLKKEMEIPL